MGFRLDPLDAEAERDLALMEGEFLAAVRELPIALQGKAYLALASRPGDASGRSGFLARFYAPAWLLVRDLSEGLRAGPEKRNLALRIQALGFAIHLLDDHLCDGQLARGPACLHLRTLVWNRYRAAAAELSGDAGSRALASLQGEYLEAIGDAALPSCPAAYAARFLRQIAIWRASPLLLAQSCGRPATAEAALRILDAFCLAWRWVDDLDDWREDFAWGSVTAVPLALRQSLPEGARLPQEPERFVSLCREQGIADKLRDGVGYWLNAARRECQEAGFVRTGRMLASLVLEPSVW